MDDSWTNPHGEFRERLHGYPPPPPPPPPPLQSHTVMAQPRLLRCSLVNLSPCEERNAILELEEANQRLKDMNQELRGRLEDIMEPREIRQDFIPVCPNHQRQLQILAWDKECPQMMDEPRTVQVLKQKICPREDPFTEKSQKELQKMRLSFERKKTSITEQPGLLFLLAQVWDGMSEVHMSLTDQAEGLLNLKKDIRTVLDEVEDIRMEILRDKAQSQSLTRRGLVIPEKKSPQPPPPCVQEDDNCWTSARRWLGSWFPVFKRLLNEKKICLLLLGSTGQKQEHQLEVKRKSWTFFSKAGLCLLVCSVLFYMYIVNPTPYECLLPPIIGQRTLWRIRTWFNPFLRVEVDDFLPF
ncbi:coiled-coil domain-containing protein 188 isoform X1 [Sarcophilus harrisii]|uniref:coiled-coil domain-containing protein 188 isoform X1 n=1 Tax=Sarcophilus harrisii TaxID=9305 RepID=UPI001301F00D|nr:coiled-coil domain-containing protein 188 isoform X1 [Sarcophilus harrisii]XP_031804880.1 coiled-coil domain-containing protein 188 isoform X1 [Sarcophilus harrisii]